jgi:hypothetical protein
VILVILRENWLKEQMEDEFIIAPDVFTKVTGKELKKDFAITVDLKKPMEELDL